MVSCPIPKSLRSHVQLSCHRRTSSCHRRTSSCHHSTSPCHHRTSPEEASPRADGGTPRSLRAACCTAPTTHSRTRAIQPAGAAPCGSRPGRETGRWWCPLRARPAWRWRSGGLPRDSDGAAPTRTTRDGAEKCEQENPRRGKMILRFGSDCDCSPRG